MSNSSQEHGKIFSLLIGLIVLGLFFLYLKKSGTLDEIKSSFRAMSSHSD